MTPLKNAMYNVLLGKENVCCLCFEAVETNNAIRIDDEVFLNENEKSTFVELSEVVAFIFGSDVGDLASETVCKQCATSALNCYIFTKKCKENSKNFQQAIESLNNCLQNAIEPERIPDCKSLFVSLDAGYAAKEYYDYKRPVTKRSVILKRFKSISRETHANSYLQDIKNDDEFDADIKAPMVKQEATNYKCKTIFKDLISHKDSKPLACKCKTCLKTFKDYDHLRRHYLRIHAPKRFKCSKCERSYGAVNFLETHLKTCRGTVPIPRDLILHEDSEPLAYKCKNCLKIYKDFRHLRDHYVSVHAPKKFKCPKCERRYGAYNLLERHLQISHVTCICAECGKRYTNQYSLKKHELEHQLGVRFVCQKCGRNYTNKVSFREHTVFGVCQQSGRKSSKEGLFICDTCNKRYSSKNALTAHIRCAHRDTSSPFDCTWCGKKFNCPSSLKDHLPKHTQEKNFPCEICDKRFVNKMSLLYHTRIHTGEKPYECSSCGERFVNSSRRAEHYRSRHTDDTVSCDVCGAELKNRSGLRKHKLRHCNRESKLFKIKDEPKQRRPSTRRRAC